MSILQYMDSPSLSVSSSECYDDVPEIVIDSAIDDLDNLIERSQSVVKNTFEIVQSPRPVPRELKHRAISTSSQLETLSRRYHGAQSIEALYLEKSDKNFAIEDRSVSADLDLALPSRKSPEENDKINTFFALELQGEVTNAEKALSAVELPYSLNTSRVPALTQEIALNILRGHSAPPCTAQEKKVLGSGAYGEVVKTNLQGVPCAAKMYYKDGFASVELQSLLKLSTHPNVIQVLHADNKAVYLELAEKGSLTRVRETLSRKDLMNVLHQAAEGLAHIHREGFVHRDIKPDNILVTNDNTAKIGDLGTLIAVENFDPSEDSRGTVEYFSPEYLLSETKTKEVQKVDVWAFGVTLWTTLKKQEVRNLYNKDHYMAVASVIGDRNRGWTLAELAPMLDPKKIAELDPDGQLQKLIEDCLKTDPNDRPTMLSVSDRLKSLC